MNYQRIYNSIIERGKRTLIHGYFERHHIVPKCLGGSNDCTNIVELTPEEHYVCHQLLCKIYPAVYKLKLGLKAMLMSNKGQVRREAALGQSLAQSGKKASPETKAKMSTTRKGRPAHNKDGSVSAETKRKISESSKGRIPSAESTRKNSESNKLAWIKRRVSSPHHQT